MNSGKRKKEKGTNNFLRIINDNAAQPLLTTSLSKGEKIIKASVFKLFDDTHLNFLETLAHGCKMTDIHQLRNFLQSSKDKLNVKTQVKSTRQCFFCFDDDESTGFI